MRNGSEPKTYQKKDLFLSKLFLVYAIIMIIASCENITAPEVIPETVPEIFTKEETIFFMEIKPIKEFGAYAVLGKQVYGLGNGVKELLYFEDTENLNYHPENFFTKNGKVFFTIIENTVDNSDPENPVNVPVTHYLVQTGAEIAETEEGLFPLVPESVRQEMGVAPWSIKTVDQGDIIYSSLKDELAQNIETGKNHITIDGYFVDGDMIWYSVTTDGVEKEPGLFNSIHGSKRFPKTAGNWRVWRLL